MDVDGLDTFSAYDSAPALDDGEPLGLGMSLDEAIAANRPKKTSQPPRKKASGGGGDASARVYVGNMKYETTWQQLKDHFATCANVVHARVLEGRTGRSMGCGIVEFGSPQDAQNAIATMHDGELDGRKLLVREDREEEKPQQQPAKKKRERERNDDVHTVGKKLYVGNLNYQTTWQQLKDHFKDCGRVARADAEETASRTKASVPTGVPSTGWPDATVEPSPRSIAADWASSEPWRGSPRAMTHGRRARAVSTRTCPPAARLGP